jgi:Zn-dependent protease with chaperone function
VYLVICLPLVLPLLAAAAARPLAERLPPVVASWLLAGSALALAAASSAVLGLLALTALLRIPLAAAAGGMSVRVLSQDAPASLPIAVAAGALLAVSATAAGRALWRRAGALAAAFGQARRLPGAAQLVVTDDETADAYTLPGWPCRIVVTAGMMRALTPAERQVLLAHEQTHATWFHYLFTSAARVAAAANPLLRPVATAVGYTVERWADERSARITGNRPLAARAIAQAAMAATADPSRRPRHPNPAVALGMVRGERGRGRPGLWGLWGLWGRPGPVPRRVAALLRPPPRPHLVLLTVAVLLVAVSGISALEASRDLHSLLELAQAAGR